MVTGITQSKIHVLPEDLIGRIAAGEVIERPAAVVKELIDNSLDAGSTSLTVDIAGGGLNRIQVTDDGEGMSREDVRLAFRRHATSKLTSDQDLWAIRTLGFRGEALPSIAAVATVHVATMVPGSELGTDITVRGGVVESVEDVAAAPGTRIEIQDLFFNTPARKKFLKSPTTEFSHILQAIQQAALAWPSVQFRLIHNGSEVLHCPSVPSLRDRLLQIYRDSLLGHMVPVCRERAGIRIEGVTIGAAHLRGVRTPQELFVNRRPVKNATILHAVTDAYGPQIARGRYPQFVLFLDVAPARLDVNVHPAKREVRFADKDLIHQSVRQAVKDALSVGAGSSDAGATSIARVIEESFGEAGGARMGASLAAEPPGVFRAVSGDPSEQTRFDAPPTILSPSDSPSSLALDQADIMPLGQIDRTYLVVQTANELQVVDQHTAHERVLYERLMRSWRSRSVQAQTLLTPVPLELPPHQSLLIEPHLEELEKLGLGIERFGSGSFLLRTMPSLLGTTDGLALVQGLLDDAEDWRTHASLETKMHPVISTLACHSAVRAGRRMALPEIQRLVRDWIGEGMMMTCPHGRRVALRLPVDELSKMFGRG